MFHYSKTSDHGRLLRRSIPTQLIYSSNVPFVYQFYFVSYVKLFMNRFKWCNPANTTLSTHLLAFTTTPEMECFTIN